MQVLRIASHSLIYKADDKAHRVTVIAYFPDEAKYKVWSNLSQDQIKHIVTEDYDKAFQCYQLWEDRSKEETVGGEYKIKKVFY